MDIFTLFPTISTSFIVISAVLVAIGWRQIIQGKREAHKKTMIAAAVAAILFPGVLVKNDIRGEYDLGRTG